MCMYCKDTRYVKIIKNTVEKSTNVVGLTIVDMFSTVRKWRMCLSVRSFRCNIYKEAAPRSSGKRNNFFKNEINGMTVGLDL